MSELGYKAKAAAAHVGDKIDAAGSAMKHGTQEAFHGAKSDVATENAKNPNLSAGTRVGQGATGVKEKVKEVFHGGAKEGEKARFNA